MFKRSLATLLVLLLAALWCGHADAGIYGTANGTYDFSTGDAGTNGGIGADNSAGAGFATFSDKFVLSNGMLIDDLVLTSIWTGNQMTAFTTGAFTVKAEGGSTCKSFTFKDLAIHDYDGSTNLNSITVTTKRADGSTIATHASGVLSFNSTTPTQLSTLINGGTQFNDSFVASVVISWTFQGGAAPSNLNFDNITIANVSALSAPTVSSISPASGPTVGGTSVAITGTGFVNGATVTIGGAAATGVSWNSATSLSATTPAGTAGAKDVVVTNPDTQTGTLSNGFTYIANTAPTFVGVVTTLTVNRNAPATDIKGLLHVSDADSSQTETWTVTSGPSQGILSGFPATASSGFADITPGGTITYQPTAGYSGSDSFTVQVSDGIATASRTITVTVVPPPTVTAAMINISGASGTGGAYKIGDTVTATWNNTALGDNNTGVTTVTVDFSQFGGGAAVAATDSGNTWTATYTIAAGAIEAVNRNVSVTATNGAGSTTTADTTNATVDNVAPTIGSGTLAASNGYLDITFSEGIYGANNGATPLSAAKLALTFTPNGSTATVVISSVKKNNSTVEGSATALTGGETTVRVFFAISGTPSGVETVEIKPANGSSVYDQAGNAMSAAQTSGVKTLNDKLAPTMISATRTDNTHITVTLNENCLNLTKANDGGFTVAETGAPGITYAVSAIAQGGDASHVVLTVADMGVSAKEGVTVTYASGGNGTVQDIAGNAMATDGTGVAVAAWDTTAPTAAISYSPTGAYTTGTVITITATFSEAMATSPVPRIAISGANSLGAADMTFVSPTSYTYAYTVTAGNGIATVTLSNGTDLAGNPLVTTPTSGASFTVLPQVFHAIPGGASSGSCEDWAHGCELSYALATAVSGQEIWVKSGTYKPTAGADRTQTFQLKSNVALYGGFAGSEIARGDRNPTTNVTSLSGDLLGDDGPGFTSRSDNSLHVVTGADSATLDGFTVTGGNADGTNPADPAMFGGGMLNNNASPIVIACVFNDNTGSAGAGMGNINGAAPTVTDCTFSANLSDSGAGMLNYGASPAVTGCTFSGNQAGDGGGMLSSGGTPAIVNCTFSGNTATHGGGMLNDASNPVLTNCSFSGNSASNNGGAIFNSTGASPTIRNSIFWGDSGPGGEIYTDSGTPTVTYSVVQGGYVGTGNIDVDPLLASLGSYGGATRTMALLPGSAAIDTGDAASCAATDQRGIARPQGAGCDLGAFESQGFTLTKTGGNNQSALITTAFANPLELTVTPNNAGEPVDNGVVTFTAPGAGASTNPAITSTTISGGAVSRSVTANATTGSYSVTATAAGASGVTFSLTNWALPAITSAASASFTYGTAASFPVTTTGYPAPAISHSGVLPTGVFLHDNGDGSATLYGTPNASGTFAFTVTAANSAGSANQNFTLTVNAAGDPVSAVDSIAVSPHRHLFGVIPLGGCGDIVPFTVRNNGAAAVTIAPASVAGPDAGEFSIAGDGCAGPLGAGASCTIGIQFCPTSQGSKAAQLQIGHDGVIVTAFLHNHESLQEEAARRMPPVLSQLNIPAIMQAGQTYTITWSLLGYDEDYLSRVVFFDCNGLAAGTCGNSFASNFADSGNMSAVATATGDWNYNGITSRRFDYSYRFTAPAIPTDIVIRFYRKTAGDDAAGKGSLSLLIPGNVAPAGTSYYDAEGRRLQHTIQ